MSGDLILAIESSCDETAVALVRGGEVLAHQVASQVEDHRPFGGVVPELASRRHNVALPPLIRGVVDEAAVRLVEVDAFAATSGPGLASSLLVGSTTAKALALSLGKPFLAINHLEGHLLSPFLGDSQGLVPNVSLVVSGGHTLLVEVRDFADYRLLGTTLDDAAGEAFDKVAKMLGLPYPGGPEIDERAALGDAKAFAFPRSLLSQGDWRFSFSGLKTAVLYAIRDLQEPLAPRLNDLCASFQAAVVEVLVSKTLEAAEGTGCGTVTMSGGVSGNRGLRQAMQTACEGRGLALRLAPGWLCTDNAAMIAQVAALKLANRETSPLEEDVNPNLRLTPA
ncbi:MAG: tRNA (adenosine(37)-N6)-threonylcarbamoyltransferase complex transferase subunit TsaD [Verrucomicrobiota bacterium]